METQHAKKHYPLWMYVLILFAIIFIGFFVYWKFYKPEKLVLVASGHPEWAPIMWKDGDKIVGAGPDLVNKICADLKISCEIKYEGQWQEVQDKAKTGEVDMLVAAYKTDERLTYMDYSDAYTIDPITLFIKSGVSFPYDKWDDLINKKGVIMVGDSYGQEFDDYIKEKLTVNLVPTAKEAFDKILNGEEDYFIYCLYCGKKEIKNLGLSGKVESIPNYIAAEDFYISISKKSPFAKYMPKINELVNKYKNDGTIDKLVKQNEDLAGIGSK